MQNFLRIGEKQIDVSINGTPLSSFSIVIPSCGGFKAPSMAESWVKKAARVLQKYLFALTGVSLPIYQDSYPVRTEGNFYVGNCLRALLAPIELAEEEYRYEIRGKDVQVLGGKRGLLYGVYDFLEKELGVRFFTSDVEMVLERESIDLRDGVETYLPPLEYRELCDPNAWDAEFSVKSKLNGNFVRALREEDGGSFGFAGGFDGLVHTFSKLVSSRRYFASHPEYFAFDGEKRNPNGLCLTNEGTLEALLETAEEWLEKEDDPRLLSVSINDAFMTYCRCPRCQKRLEGGENDTDLYLDFVNKVSERLHERFPRVKVEALLYHEMVALPLRVRPNRDVVLRYCPPATRKMGMEEAAKRYLETKEPGLEPSFLTVKTIEEWSKMTDTLYVWDYPYNYYLSNLIFPVWGSLREDMAFFLKHHAKGVYYNGQGEFASFNELETYLLAKLMYRPDMDEEECARHIDEFLTGYYGEAAPHLKEYMSLSARLSKPYFPSFAGPFDIIPEENAEEYLSKGSALLSSAYEAVKETGQKDRVEKVGLTLLYYDILAFQEKAYRSGDSLRIDEYERKYKTLYRESLRLGITRIGENVFLPVVKNFRQPIQETFFWEMREEAFQDRNNEACSRSLYLLLPAEGELGEEVALDLLCRTNNEDPRGEIFTYCHGAFSPSGHTPVWHLEGDYRPLLLRGEITNVERIAKRFSLDVEGVFLNLIPREQKGLMLRVKSMDPGAYIAFKKAKGGR